MKAVALKIVLSLAVIIVAAIVHSTLMANGVLLGGLGFAILFSLILILPLTLILRWKPKFSARERQPHKPLRLRRDVPAQEAQPQPPTPSPIFTESDAIQALQKKAETEQPKSCLGVLLVICLCLLFVLVWSIVGACVELFV